MVRLCVGSVPASGSDSRNFLSIKELKSHEPQTPARACLGQLAQQVRQAVHEVEVKAYAAPHVRPLHLDRDLGPPVARRQHAPVHLRGRNAH